MGNECGKTANESERVEDEPPCPVAPRFAEVPDHLAVLAKHEATLGEGRSRHVPKKTFQRFARVSLKARRGVQRIAIRSRDQRAAGQIELLLARRGCERRIDGLRDLVTCAARGARQE